MNFGKIIIQKQTTQWKEPRLDKWNKMIDLQLLLITNSKDKEDERVFFFQRIYKVRVCVCTAIQQQHFSFISFSFLLTFVAVGMNKYTYIKYK